LTLEGAGVERLDQEAGGHRIQRIPPSERRGRVHSSTVTVAILDPTRPAPRPYQQREEKDFHIAFFSGTGPGGQNRNKVQASARVTHLPTGLVRTAQTRSRENSVRLAKQALLEDLQRAQAGAQAQAQRTERLAQMGLGERGDKRRTYRFQDDQVLDHRTGRKGRASRVMLGYFEPLWAPAA
jgi:protein subunit release factor A